MHDENGSSQDANAKRPSPSTDARSRSISEVETSFDSYPIMQKYVIKTSQVPAAPRSCISIRQHLYSPFSQQFRLYQRFAAVSIPIRPPITAEMTSEPRVLGMASSRCLLVSSCLIGVPFTSTASITSFLGIISEEQFDFSLSVPSAYPR
jgi:hypothetical protein